MVAREKNSGGHTGSAEVDGPLTRARDAARVVRAEVADTALGARLEPLAPAKADDVGGAVGVGGAAVRGGARDHLAHEALLLLMTSAPTIHAIMHATSRQYGLGMGEGRTAHDGRPSRTAATAAVAVSGTGTAATGMVVARATKAEKMVVNFILSRRADNEVVKI